MGRPLLSISESIDETWTCQSKSWSAATAGRARSARAGAPSCGAGAPLLSPFFVRREVDLRRGMASGWPGAELVLWVLMVLRCETVPRADPPRRRVAAWRAAFSPRSARFASWSDACSRQLTSSVFFEPHPASAAWASETGAMAAGGSDPCRAAMPPPAQDVSAGARSARACCDRSASLWGPAGAALEWPVVASHADKHPVTLFYLHAGARESNGASSAFVQEWDEWRAGGVAVVPLYGEKTDDGSENAAAFSADAGGAALEPASAALSDASSAVLAVRTAIAGGAAAEFGGKGRKALGDDPSAVTVLMAGLTREETKTMFAVFADTHGVPKSNIIALPETRASGAKKS
mgnify:CR=1 FL=1